MAFANRDFDYSFQKALASKLRLQEAQAGAFDSKALLDRTEASVTIPEAQALANYRDSQTFAKDAETRNLFDTSRTAINTQPLRRPSLIDQAGYDRVSQFRNDAEANGTARTAYSDDDYAYAEGGEVSSPMSADYDLYRKAAMDAGVSILPPQYAIPRMAQIRGRERQKLLANIAAGATTPGYAQGGEVDVGGAMVRGAGHGKSDSIPAVIDGEQPAALSNGEFVVPQHVVEFYGTKYFDTLLEKARMSDRKAKKKTALANGGTVPSQKTAVPTLDNVKQLRMSAAQAVADGHPDLAVDMMSNIQGAPLQPQSTQAIRNAIDAEKFRLRVLKGEVN